MKRVALIAPVVLLALPQGAAAQRHVEERRAVTPDASIRVSGPFSSIRIIGWDKDSLGVIATIPNGARFDGNFLSKAGEAAPAVKIYVDVLKDIPGVTAQI